MPCRFTNFGVINAMRFSVNCVQWGISTREHARRAVPVKQKKYFQYFSVGKQTQKIVPPALANQEADVLPVIEAFQFSRMIKSR